MSRSSPAKGLTPGPAHGSHLTCYLTETNRNVSAHNVYIFSVLGFNFAGPLFESKCFVDSIRIGRNSPFVGYLVYTRSQIITKEITNITREPSKKLPIATKGVLHKMVVSGVNRDLHEESVASFMSPP